MSRWYEFGECLVNFDNISCVEMEENFLHLHATSGKKHSVEFQDENDMQEAFEELREWLQDE